MADVRNCAKCGKMFQYVNSPVCQNCIAIEQDEFKRVKEYLYDNPGATMTELVSELNISTRKITRFLREGRIEIFGEKSNLILGCENCGKAIKSGRFCGECEAGLKKEIGGALKSGVSVENTEQSDKKKGGSTMKYLNRNER
jgi:flagellar operon protein (TIGR03826 family)